MLRRLVVVLAVVLVAPAPADAANVGVSDGVLRYVAAPGKVNNVELHESAGGVVLVQRATADDDPLVGGANCMPSGVTNLRCTGVTQSVEVDLGDLSDRVTATFRAARSARASRACR